MSNRIFTPDIFITIRPAPFGECIRAAQERDSGSRGELAVPVVNAVAALADHAFDVPAQVTAGPAGSVVDTLNAIDFDARLNSGLSLVDQPARAGWSVLWAQVAPR